MTDVSGQAQIAPGIQFGKYRIIRKLAIGGMAELFLAKQTGLGGFERTVVLKCILPHLAPETQFITMFLDEARVASLLNHPNIVQIYEIGEVEGVCYISMEYIRGPNLKAFRKRLYERNPRPHFGMLAGIVAQAAAGLHHAHMATDERGKPMHIVHRDVSPTNLLLSYTGAVKLVDFGVAKASIQEHKTKAGMVKGKYRYMSPEQVLDEPIDHRSDVYALGAILYELTTNVVVFGRRTEAETIRAVYMDPIMPPTQLIEGYPEELNHIVMKALARDINERYETADELRGVLQEFMYSRGQTFGNREISDILQSLFVEELEYDRTGMSGAALSKSDYRRFSTEAPSSVGSLPGGALLPPPEERTMPSADPIPQRDPFGQQEASLTAPSSPSLQHKRTEPTPGSHYQEPTRTGVPWWLLLVVAAAAIGGAFLIISTQDPPAQPIARKAKTRPKVGPSFNTLAREIQALLGAGKLSQAASKMEALRQKAETTTHQGLLARLQQEIDCAPKLTTAKALYGASAYKQAKVILDDLKQRCGLVPDVTILSDQVDQALQPKRIKPPPRTRKRRPRWRRRRPWRRRRRPKTPQAPKKGKLFVNAPASSRVELDGTLFGFAPINGKSVPEGTHRITVLLRGHRPYEKTIVVQPGETTVVTASMTRIAPLIRRRPLVIRRRPPVAIPALPAQRKAGPRLPFSAIRLPKSTTLRVFISDPRGILGRRYTGQHPALCRRIERELRRVMGANYAIKGITRPWQSYIRRYGARLAQDRLTFYPRAVAYLIYTQLKRGRKKRRISQIVVKYERYKRWSRFINR